MPLTPENSSAIPRTQGCNPENLSFHDLSPLAAYHTYDVLISDPDEERKETSSTNSPIGSADFLSEPFSTAIITKAGTKMAPEDTRAAFMRIPWAARMLNKPGVICCVPASRVPKLSTEDSLMAEILKSSRTIRSCISFYTEPASETSTEVPEVSTLMTIGDGMNGHPEIIHGGMTATLCDENMGMLQGVNRERAHMVKVKQGRAQGELPPGDSPTFTAELKITYLRPVRTPGWLVLTSKTVKKEGRKHWIRTELKQCQDQSEDDDGEMVTCAIGEALFIAAKAKSAKL